MHVTPAIADDANNGIAHSHTPPYSGASEMGVLDPSLRLGEHAFDALERFNMHILHDIHDEWADC